MVDSIFNIGGDDDSGSKQSFIPKESSLHASKVWTDFENKLEGLEASIIKQDNKDLQELAGKLEKDLDTTEIQLTEDSITLNGQHPGLRYPTIKQMSDLLKPQIEQVLTLYANPPVPPKMPEGSPPKHIVTKAQFKKFEQELVKYQNDLAKYEKDLESVTSNILKKVLKPLEALLAPPTGKKQKIAQATEIEWLENSVKSAVASGVRSLTVHDFAPLFTPGKATGTTLVDVQNRLITDMDHAIQNSPLFPDVLNFTFVDNIKAEIVLQITDAIFGTSTGSPPSSPPGLITTQVTGSPPNTVVTEEVTLNQSDLTKYLKTALDKTFDNLGEMGLQGSAISYGEFTEKASETSTYIANLVKLVKSYDTMVAQAKDATMTAAQNISSTRITMEEFVENYGEAKKAILAARSSQQGTDSLNKFMIDKLNSSQKVVDKMLPELAGHNNPSNAQNISNAELAGVKSAAAVAGLNETSSTLSADVNTASQNAKAILTDAQTDFDSALKNLKTAMATYTKSVASYVNAEYNYNLSFQLQIAELDALKAVEKIAGR